MKAYTSIKEIHHDLATKGEYYPREFAEGVELQWEMFGLLMMAEEAMRGGDIARREMAGTIEKFLTSHGVNNNDFEARTSKEASK